MGYIHASMSESAEQGVQICLENNTAWNTWSGSAQGGKILNCDGTWHTFEARLSSKEGYNNSNYITIYCDGDKEYCIKNLVIYKPVSESDIPGIVAPPTGWNEDKTIYTVDLSKGNASWQQQDNVIIDYLQDGSANITWTENAGNYAGAIFTFDAIDVSGFAYVVIDASGDNMTLEVQDATRQEPDWGNPLASILKYGLPFPAKIALTDSQFGDRVGKDGEKPTYSNIGKISFAKGTEKNVKSLRVKTIRFYKNADDVPQGIVDRS